MEDLLNELIAQTGVPALWIITAGVLMGGFIRGFVGFGGAMIVVLAISLTLGPKIAVAASCLSGLPVMFQLLPTAIRKSERAFVLPFGLATFVGAPLGAMVLVALDPAIMKFVIAISSLGMTFLLFKGWRAKQAGNPVFLAGAGTTAGFIQGMAGVGGPPAVAVALSRSGTTDRQRANVIGSITGLNLCTIVPLYLHGLFTPTVILLSGLIFPVYLGAAWLGDRFFGGPGEPLYRNAALAVLALISAVTLIASLRDLVSG